MTGPGVTGAEPVKDLDRREVGALVPLLLALVLFGFYPMPLLDVINPTVDDDPRGRRGRTTRPRRSTARRRHAQEATTDGRVRQAHHRVRPPLRRCS